MPKILIAGGTGLVGTALTHACIAQGYSVAHLSRTPTQGATPTFAWDIPKQYIDAQAFEGIDYLINLAGAGIADQKWTAQRKKEILDSRTQGTQLLINALAQRKHTLKAVIQASAVGYYGSNCTHTFTENDPPATDFMADVCHKWEQSAENFAKKLHIRTTTLRIGVVLSTHSGALPQLTKPFAFGAGAALGSGNQYVSWIHIQDLVNMILFALENPQIQGIYNAVAPAPITNKILTQTIGKVLKKWVMPINVPATALQLMLGEMAQVVLGSQRVSCQKITDAGFVFKYPLPTAALQNLLKPNEQ
jgi:uncharacterized protein (TIGR01777 family)